MKNLTDYDLDVMNVTNGFPKNETDGFIYIRGRLDFMKIQKGFLYTKTTPSLLSAMIYTLIENNEGSKYAVFNAVLNHLKSDKKEADLFIQMINKLNQ